jgi:hypothetical protein
VEGTVTIVHLLELGQIAVYVVSKLNFTTAARVTDASSGGTSGAIPPISDILSVHVSSLCNSAGSRFRTVCVSSRFVFRAPERTPAYSSYCSLKMGIHSRHKVASLLPTRSRCLNRLYSHSLCTGSLQDFQRPYLHGVPHNNTSTGRACWHGRNSLFSAEIPR